MEKCYQGRFHVNMIAEYCWMLKLEASNKGKPQHNKRSIKDKKNFWPYNLHKINH